MICPVRYFILFGGVMKNSKITTLTDCAVMIALAFALSFAKIYEMPLGGSVTVASMLPIMLISIKYGNLIGVGTAFVYSITQAFQALITGNVFPYCETGLTLAVCVLFDYIVPFTVLGFAGAFKNFRFAKRQEIGAYIGMCLTVLIRFFCHFFTGVVIWGQWAPDGMGKYIYSLAYNGSFLSVDFAICIICAVLMLRKSEIRKLINLN